MIFPVQADAMDLVQHIGWIFYPPGRWPNRYNYHKGLYHHALEWYQRQPFDKKKRKPEYFLYSGIALISIKTKLLEEIGMVLGVS